MPQAARASKKSKVYRYPLPFRAEAKIFFPVLCPFDRGKESAFAVLSHCHFERSEKSAFLHLFTIILCKPSFPFCHLVYNNDGGVKGGRGRLRLGF
jgi:hypothetical protein